MVAVSANLPAPGNFAAIGLQNWIQSHARCICDPRSWHITLAAALHCRMRLLVKSRFRDMLRKHEKEHIFHCNLHALGFSTHDGASLPTFSSTDACG
jgi:hypothetical protein